MIQCPNSNCRHPNPPGNKFCVRCRSVLLIGRKLRSRYEIIKKIGNGGFGDTYLARDLDLPGTHSGDHLCVVKHLKPKNPHPDVFSTAKKLFFREADSLYDLSEYAPRSGTCGGRIPRLYARFEEDGEFYLVQELVDGHDLSEEILLDEPWSEEETVNLLREILEVLAVVHQKNIIHRDIKPSNIMRRNRDKKLVLIDFGAVKEIRTLTVKLVGV